MIFFYYSKMLLVTGASGFIGASLLKRPMPRVRLVVRSRSSALMGSRDVFEVPDISSVTRWDGAFEGVECVVHLAAAAHAGRLADARQLDVVREVNVFGAERLARAAALSGVRRFVFLSSVGVNGSVSARPFTEGDTPAPSGAYAVSKWEAEIALGRVSKETGLEVVCVRAPLVYGPNAPGTFGRLVRAVQHGMPMPFGGITSMRSFVAVENLIDFISLCTQHPASANETFLVSDRQDMSVAQFIGMLCGAFGRPSQLFNVPRGILRSAAGLLGRRDEAMKLTVPLQVDASKAAQVLGWAPRISVERQMREIALAHG